jgi:GNAT superfamily N-acetyltransferase
LTAVLWEIQLLSDRHSCAGFDCGKASLNSWLNRYALSNMSLGLSRTFVAVESGKTRVDGFFCISAGAVKFDQIPEHEKKRLPRYPIPTIHIGRLAVDRTVQGHGLGSALLVEALRRAANVSEDIGIHAVDVIALDEGAKRFYLKYGFTEMLDNALHLFLPIATARMLAAGTDWGDR